MLLLLVAVVVVVVAAAAGGPSERSVHCLYAWIPLSVCSANQTNERQTLMAEKHTQRGKDATTALR